MYRLLSFALTIYCVLSGIDFVGGEVWPSHAISSDYRES